MTVITVRWEKEKGSSASVRVSAEAEVHIPLFSDELQMSYSPYSLPALAEYAHIYSSV